MKKRRFQFFALLLIFLVLGCSTSSPKLSPVKNQNVCMVNNKHYGKKQIPIKIKKQTYYGCCKLCQGALKNEKKVRYARDPISHKRVNKATAIIGANEDNKVFYFESQENLKKYNQSLNKD